MFETISVITFIVGVVGIFIALILVVGLDLDGNAGYILLAIAFIALILAMVFACIGKRVDEREYMIYKVETNRIWLKKEDGTYFWVDYLDIHGKKEGDHIELAPVELERYETSTEDF